jgi:hypothetical protein
MGDSNTSASVRSWPVDIALFLVPVIISTQLPIENEVTIEFLEMIPLGLGGYAERNAEAAVFLSIPVVSAILAWRHHRQSDDSRMQRVGRFIILFFPMLMLQVVLVALSLFGTFHHPLIR